MNDTTPLMVGLEGPRADRKAVHLLKETGAASVLLLARNIESPAQVRGLTRELEQRLGRRLIFAIDHEGGWVLRFMSGLTAFPGNAALGKAGDPALARKTGQRMAEELGAIGINLNLAPVLDVLGPKYNPGIHIRSFGQDPALVSRMGAAFICGQQGHRVAACAKHFPGKGAARKDAHLTLPLIPCSKREMSRHLAPFKAAVKAGVASIMSSHAVYPALDPSKAPSTFSKPIITGLLRGSLGFKGAAISDDLCMGAVTESRSIPEAALDAYLAGHDLLIIAHVPEAMFETAELLKTAVADGRIAARRWRESLARLEGLLEFHPKSGPSPKPDEALALKVARMAVEVANKGAVPLPLLLQGQKVAVLWPSFKEVRERFTFEGGPEAPLKRLKARLSRWPAKLSFVPTPIVSEASAKAALEAAKKADITLFFCFEAMRFPGQKRALDALQKAVPERLVACLLRNPWDRELLKSCVTAIHAYGYRDCQVKALLEAIRQ